jgi:RNase H-fold protein (predicted Holliday junction resolvase)
MKQKVDTIIAIDPGRYKCGIAIVKKSIDSNCSCKKLIDCLDVIFKEVIETNVLADEIKLLSANYSPDLIIVGNGTASADIIQKITELNISPIKEICEKSSTLQARALYFKDNPCKGLKKLIPLSL